MRLYIFSVYLIIFYYYYYYCFNLSFNASLCRYTLTTVMICFLSGPKMQNTNTAGGW